MDQKGLMKAAMDAREYAYTPYSNYRVGAALLTKSGKIYSGCNIENAAYTPTICAERTAFSKAVSEGEMEFSAIAVVGGPKDNPLELAPPCGVCRQVMMEFCDPSTFRVVLGTSEEDYREYTLEELLPSGFGPGNLKKREEE